MLAILDVEELYYQCSEHKGADQLRRSVIAKLISAFVFAYADCWFSHAVAKFSTNASLSYDSPVNKTLIIIGLFSSPEPSGSQGELIVYPCSVVRPSVRRPSSVRRPPFSKIFSSETAWPIKAKFYMKHLWEGGTNVYINNPGHMTKMAAMPIYGTNPSKIFFSGTTGPISTKLGMKH